MFLLSEFFNSCLFGWACHVLLRDMLQFISNNIKTFIIIVYYVCIFKHTNILCISMYIYNSSCYITFIHIMSSCFLNNSFILTKAAFIWFKVQKTIILWNIILIQNNLYLFLNVIYSCNRKLNFQQPLLEYLVLQYSLRDIQPRFL